MPRGKFVNHKGRNRKFTSPEELEQERKNEEAKKRSRKQKVEEDGSDEESGSEEEGSAEENSEESESDSSEDRKAVGHHALIDIENPNRVHKKAVQKISSLTLNPKAQSSSGDGAAAPVEQLSRREREEIEKQKSRDAYQKLHAEGKTDQAKADLARLAIIKQQRAEAAARREAEKKEKEAKQKPAAK